MTNPARGAENKIILAMDVSEENEIDRLFNIFSGRIQTLKIGKQLFTRFGPRIVKRAQEYKFDVFLDLKYHDIPNTVKSAVYEAARLGVTMLTVHASGGRQMLEAAVSGATEGANAFGTKKPLVFGVTVLTSLSQAAINEELGIPGDIISAVKRLALLAKCSGSDGVIASAHEISVIKKECGQEFLVVTPGIRPSWSQKQDQKRVMSPAEAIRAGSDYLVIGRSILQESDPLEALKRIEDEMR